MNYISLERTIMEEQLNPDAQLHPEIANQIGVQQEKKLHDVHPSLRAELEPEEEVVEKQASNEEEVVENPTEEPTVDTLSTAQVQETSKDKNWRALREEAARSKELERELQFYRNQPPPKASDDEDLDEYTTKKELRALEQRQRELESRAQKAEQAAAVSRAERRLIEDYPDIRDVVSDANIQRLQDEHPHLYNSVIASSDVYTVGAAAHEMIIAKGIYKKSADTLKSIAASNSSVRNKAKPASASQVAANSGTTPIARANSYMGNSISSEDERKAIWAEMHQAAYGRK